MGQNCVRCQKPATVNIQKLWVIWKYDAENEKYSRKHELLDIEPSGSENLHLCDGCESLWKQGKF
jgi:hypothetical protein